MPPTRYMELDSNYRNRKEFNKQASFEVGISQNGMHTNINAVDPITDAYPAIVFEPDNFGNPTLTFTYASGITAASSSPIFIVSVPAGTPLVSGYYVGAVIEQKNSSAATVAYYRILEWEPVNSSTSLNVKITVDRTIDLVVGTSFEISSPTDLTLGYVFIPTSKSIDNYYNKYVLWNQDLDVSVPIASYDGTTHLAKLGGDFTGFNTSHVYVVRLENPSGTGTLGVSLYYNPPTPIVNWFEIQQQVDSGYINGFVRIYKTSSASPIISGLVNPDSNIIAKIIGVKTLEYVDPTISPPPTPVRINTIILDSVPADVNANPTLYSYEIMPFTIDNYSPFVFNGSQTSQNQPVAHEITLNSLVLPNVPLKNGGRIAYYPYVYVELENLSATTRSNNNIIFSNNPHTYKAIFKVPITDLNHPSISPFVKLTGNGMTQTITFKQNDNMRVAVRLPSGVLFETVEQDTSYGQAPNVFLQISFCFGIQRI